LDASLGENGAARLLAVLRYLARRIVRLTLGLAPSAIQRRAVRLPFSRYAHLIPLVFTGQELVHWHGITLGVDPGETFGYFLFFSGDREPDSEWEWLERQSTDAMSFADIGAHIGMYAIAIARARPSIAVTAFEASPVIACRLRKNVSLNRESADRIDVIEAAVSDSSGTRAFSIAQGSNSGLGRVVDEDSVSSSTISVRTVALADYFHGRRPPDLVKIDVEGAELDVLHGWGGLPPAKAMLIELHEPSRGAGDKRPKVIEWVKDRGYEIEYLIDERFSRLCPSPLPGRVHLLCTHRRSR